MAAREACIAGSDELTQAGNVLCGVALLDERDRMAGSLMIVDFADREAVDAWLQTESCVIGWRLAGHRRQALPVGPSFVGLHETPAFLTPRGDVPSAATRTFTIGREPC